jgi:hypothetical protein
MKDIYIVIGENKHNNWNVMAFLSKKEADKFASELTENSKYLYHIFLDKMEEYEENKELLKPAERDINRYYVKHICLDERL